MAQAAGGGGGGGGGAEIPDVRFLLRPEERELFADITREQREQLLVGFLREHKVEPEELDMSYRMSTMMYRQAPPAVALYRRGFGLVHTILRKRRHTIFLMMMLRSFGGGHDFNIPHRYRNSGQLNGDIAALENQIQTLYAELLDVRQQVKEFSPIPLDIPDIFKEPVKLPQ